MPLAVVNTKRSSLKVYNITNSAKANEVGSLPTGARVEIVDTKISNTVRWAKIKAPGISGWVIQQHPSVSYPYLREAEPAIMLMAASVPVIDNDRVTPDSVQDASILDRSTTSTLSGESMNWYSTAKETTGWRADQTRRYTTGEMVPNPLKLNSEISISRTDHRTDVSQFPKDATNRPEVVQNYLGYPTMEGYNATKNRFVYSYATDYSSQQLQDDLQKVRRSVNIDMDNPSTIFERNTKLYNRFKSQNPNEALLKTFPHVFFVRPSCNILTYMGNGQFQMPEDVSSDPDFAYEFKNEKELLIQLCQDVGWDHDFMLYPSNKVQSFECRDRTIETDTYGRTLQGHSIAYGKSLIRSETANDLSLTFTDDRDLHVMRLHSLWVQYISAVKLGRFRPSLYTLYNRILDYATSVYYFLCAEDGETIIYWTKLYGVFPTSIPDSVMSWDKGGIMNLPEYTINYQYSWKRDMKVDTLTEFNLNSRGKSHYVPGYNPETYSSGFTWVEAPFVEFVEEDGKLRFKLRFRPHTYGKDRM